MYHLPENKDAHFSVYIRLLEEADAQVSHQWRNNPLVWRFTGSKPDRHITHEIEQAWIREVLQRKNELRFAICLKETDAYIGNVFLTDITETDAHIHVFIGEPNYWGKRMAVEACRLLLYHAAAGLGLQRVYAEINKDNKASMAVIERSGLPLDKEYFDEKRNMAIRRWLIPLIPYLKSLGIEIPAPTPNP